MNPNHKINSPDVQKAAPKRQASELAPVEGDSPELVMLQRQIGNRAMSQLMAKREGIVPAMQTLTRTGTSGAQRTHIQRNVFHSMFRGYARKNIFGSNAERREIKESTDDTKNRLKLWITDIRDVSVKSGEHTLRGRHYIGMTGKNVMDGGKYTGKTVLFLSGSGGSAETYGVDLARYYCARGADFVAVNYRGFGGSTFTNKKGQTKQMDASDITEAGVYDDSQAIFNHLQGDMGIDPGNVVIHGFSLGGPIAAQLVNHLAGKGIRVGGLVLHSPMDSVRDQAKNSAPTRGIGAFAANSSQVVMNLRAHLQALSRQPGFKDLAIHFMSGKEDQGDQLDINKTDVHNSATGMGFTNTSNTVANEGGHLAVGDHIKVAGRGQNRTTGSTPENSLDRLFASAPVVDDSSVESSSDPVEESIISSAIASVSDEVQKESAKEAEKSE